MAAYGWLVESNVAMFGFPLDSEVIIFPILVRIPIVTTSIFKYEEPEHSMAVATDIGVVYVARTNPGYKRRLWLGNYTCCDEMHH
jgi:hypothetical protein